MSQENYAFDTLKVRGGYDPRQHNNSVQVPIYQTAAFNLGSPERALRLFALEDPAPIYTRLGNPTVEVVEKRLAELHGATGAVALGSGMAAISYTLFNVTDGTGRILTTPQLYGGTVDSFKKIYPRFGIAVDLVEDPEDPQSFAKGVTPETKAIYVESISNPNAVVADLEVLAGIAHEHGIPLTVDNTFATPYLLNPFDFGADIVIYSATKLLNGHGNLIAGVVLENGQFSWDQDKYPQFYETEYTLRDSTGRERSFLDVFPTAAFTGRIRLTYLNYIGAALGPFDAYLLLLGLETLSERVAKQVASTERLIRYLDSRPEVAWVSYPGAKGYAHTARAKKYLPKGAGTVFSFGWRGSIEQAERLLTAVKLFSYHVNVGDARSLIVNSPKTTHGELTAAQQQHARITPDTIRISVGLEDPDDLIADLEQAFRAASLEAIRA